MAAAAGGKPYDQLMREQVFEPLGLARCQVGAWSVKRVGNVAQPHAWRGDRNEVVNADADISPDLPSMAAGGHPLLAARHDALDAGAVGSCRGA